MQLKINFRKAYQIYTTHIQEMAKDQAPSLGSYLECSEFEDVFS